MRKTKYYKDAYANIDDSNIILTEEGVKLVRSRISEIPFSSRKKVLDVACGISTLGLTFSNNVHGFDFNPEAIAICRKKGMKVKFGDAEKKWDYPNDSFDIVIMSHIIEHVKNPDHLISEAKRVLKKGGIMIVNTPNLAAWFNRGLLPLGYQPFFTEVSTIDKTLGIKFTRRLTSFKHPLGHMRVFTPGALVDIVEMHGFKIIKKSGLEFFILPKPLLFLDRIFSHTFSFASSLIVVAQKKK